MGKPATPPPLTPPRADHAPRHEDAPRTTDDRAAGLTAAIARGDRAAFAAFYEAWFDRCYAMARRLTQRDESACLDIVQEAMLRVGRRMRALPDEAALDAWMGRVVRSAAVDLLRRELRRAQRDERKARAAVVRGDEPDPSVVALDRDEMARLRGAIDALSTEDAAALGLRLGRGRTLDSTGAGLGTTGDAAHGRVRRAVSALRAALIGEHHD